jgi:steroid 5-alpha reductase family enzyme
MDNARSDKSGKNINLYNDLFFIGIWVLVTLLPTLYLNRKRVDKPLTKTDYIGWSLWLFGFLFEVLADSQKTAFKNNLNNKVYSLILILIQKCISSFLGKIYQYWPLEIFSTSELFR